ncbi:membrane dipeptidase [Dyadobacter sp. CY326]|uniref:membrane dipeptidase n=1 Tax=Dyadobacter sp. CY326 TaxID=2907300 RepID=UPI00286E727F|nr:membrane dipeptidase [Dyadobacter sp. CY326]
MAPANQRRLAATLKLAARPVIISHTGLNTQLGQDPEMAKRMLTRLISKEQAKMVADAGGIVGVWTHLAVTPLEYAQNIRAMVDVIGIDHVCIGTDTKMTPTYRQPSAQNNAGANQKTERVGSVPTWPGTTRNSGFTMQLLMPC